MIPNHYWSKTMQFSPSTYSHNQLKATQLSSFFTCSSFKILIFFNPVWNDSTQIDILTWFLVCALPRIMECCLLAINNINLFDTLCHVVKRGILELDLKNIYKYIYSNWFVESFISQKYKLDYIYSLAWHTGN